MYKYDYKANEASLTVLENKDCASVEIMSNYSYCAEICCEQLILIYH